MNSQKLVLFASLFFVLTAWGADTPAVELPPVLLGQGEQRLLRIPGLARYALGGPEIRVLPTAKMAFSCAKECLLMKAIQPGNTDLFVWKSDGSAEHRLVRVEKISPDVLKPELLKSLSQLDETEVIWAGGKALLRGKTVSFLESSKLFALTEAYPKEIENQTTLSESLLDAAKKKLEAKLATDPAQAKVRIETPSGELWIRGSLSSAADRIRIERTVQSIFPAARLDLESLPDDSPTVHFKVLLLELKRTRFGNLGLSWPAAQEAAFQVTSTGIQNLLQLDLALQALEGDGSVKVLSAPEIVVRAPGEAELFSGGELPIHEMSHFFSATTWKTFGLTLKLKVSQTTHEKVRLDINTEISRLDPTLTTDDSKIPGVIANRMKTQVDAVYGKPLFLSGLLQEGTRDQARGLPAFRQIPILGALFGSEDYLNERSELVAVLLPHLAPPEAPIHRPEFNYPIGPVPPPRSWITPARERELRSSADFPWNAF